MLRPNKIKCFNKIQSLSLRIRKKPILCEENHTELDIFICSQCDRILCDCHLNTAIIQERDHGLCIDCWESKYREEIVIFEEQMITEFIKKIIE